MRCRQTSPPPCEPKTIPHNGQGSPVRRSPNSIRPALYHASGARSSTYAHVCVYETQSYTMDVAAAPASRREYMLMRRIECQRNQMFLFSCPPRRCEVHAGHSWTETVPTYHPAPPPASSAWTGMPRPHNHSNPRQVVSEGGPRLEMGQGVASFSAAEASGLAPHHRSRAQRMARGLFQVRHGDP